MSTNIQQFKQQTFALIKQQATKLKTHSKQIQIKQQQIRLLKQTISILEEQKDESQRNKNNYKNKIDLIMKEVANYNDTVVQKLHNDNQQLAKKISEITPNLQQNLQIVRRLTKQLQVNEQKLQKTTVQLNKYKQFSTQWNKQSQKIKNQSIKNKQIIGEQQRKINRLQAHNQQLQNKIKSNQKHIQNLVNKCQQTANTYQRKIKNLKDNSVKKQELKKYEIEADQYIQKLAQQKKQIDKLVRQKIQIELSYKMIRQKQITNTKKAQLQTVLMDTDIRNLKQSCKITKKISQFQSKYSDIFYQIIESYLNLNNIKQQNEKKSQILQDRITQMQRLVNQKQALNQQYKNQLQILTQKLKNQSQSIQSSYQGKILQLSIKIKKQQKALQQLGIKDRQFEGLQQQYEKLAQQHIQMKQTLQNTINQYKKQNQKLTAQVQQLIQLCDQNIITKNSLNCLKHSINNLLTVVYFLHLNLVRNRESRRKIYLPFIQFYYKTRYALQNGKDNQKKSKRLLLKLRTCVTAVIALKRIEKGAKQANNSGLLRYVDRALKFKGKIQDMTEYLQNLLEKAIKYQKNVQQLLKQTKTVYKWNCLYNYMKVNIPVNWYQNMLVNKQY